MAERRMFAKTIIDSDAFLDMPISTQLLYFHLSMRADDDGFINAPKKIMRMIGVSDDDLKVLITKKFIIPFESGVVVIKHWKIHNYIRNDRYVETKYKNEKSLLMLDENDSYKTISTNGIPTVYQMDTNGIPTVSQMDTQDRIGKDSIGKYNIYSQNSDEFDTVSKVYYQNYFNIYNETCKDLPQILKETEKRKKAIKSFSKTYTIDDFKKVCEMAQSSEFISGRNNKWTNCNFDWLINTNNATKVLEGNYKDKTSNTKKGFNNYTSFDNENWEYEKSLMK